MIALPKGLHQFAEVRRKAAGVSDRMLRQTLKHVEADGFVLRTAHAVMPPPDDYQLADLGQEAVKHTVALGTSTEAALPEILSRNADKRRGEKLLQNACPRLVPLAERGGFGGRGEHSRRD